MEPRVYAMASPRSPVLNSYRSSASSILHLAARNKYDMRHTRDLSICAVSSSGDTPPQQEKIAPDIMRVRSTGAPMQRLNNIPHPRELRQHFYEEVCDAVLSALEDGLLRLSVKCIIPELNTELDVYRIGTLLEMARAIAMRIAREYGAKRVKVCVQQPLGSGVFQGMPLSLNGVMRIMQQMQWGEDEERIRLGNLGANEVDDADAFVVIAPQNITGYSVLPLLQEMIAAAEKTSKPLIVLNSKLVDVPSSGGVMGVRGRQERLDFVSTLKTVYHFRLLFLGASVYPIMGALQYRWGSPWQVFRRDDIVRDDGGKEEVYRLIGEFDKEPDASVITSCFQESRKR